MSSSYISGIELKENIIGIFVSIIIAIAMHIFVEQPFRRVSARPASAIASYLSIGLLLGFTQAGVISSAQGGAGLAFMQRPNYGLDRACDGHVFEDSDECRTSDRPSTLIWGDSYAMFFVSGARYHLPDGLAQATYSACPPFIGYAPYNPKRDQAWEAAEYCIRFNDQVLNYALNAKFVKTVVLAASFSEYTMEGFDMMLRSSDGELSLQPSTLEAAEENFGDLIATLRQKELDVIVVAPPPGAAPEDQLCAERQVARKITFGADTTCAMPTEYFSSNSLTIEEFLGEAAKKGARIIRLADAICDEQTCKTQLDGTLLYRDGAHLTYDGAKRVLDILGQKGKLPPPFR